MNTRDPFNLRAGKTAFSHLQANSSNTSREDLGPGSQPSPLLHYAHSNGASRDTDTRSEEMSFSVPRNVPSFNHPQRQLEDYTWGSSRRSRYPENAGSGVTEKITGMFGDNASKGLPMYKDKPFYYGTQRRRYGMFGRKRFLAAICFVLFAGYYFLFPASNTGEGKGKLDWMKSQKPGAINWDERREAVKNAFKLSWSAYEKHAWGIYIFNQLLHGTYTYLSRRI